MGRVGTAKAVQGRGAEDRVYEVVVSGERENVDSRGRSGGERGAETSAGGAGGVNVRQRKVVEWCFSSDVGAAELSSGAGIGEDEVKVFGKAPTREAQR